VQALQTLRPHTAVLQLHAGAMLVVKLTFQGSAVPRSSSLIAAAVEGPTQPITGLYEMEKSQGGGC
jgi:hypothetical protein